MFGMKLIVNNYFLWLSSRRNRMENLGLPGDGGRDKGRPEVHMYRAPRADDLDLGLRTRAR
jgi:hypothetical protein